MVTAVMTNLIGFNRHEAACLVGIDYHRIVYLERKAYVDLIKLGTFKKGASPIYTLRQLVCLLIADKYKTIVKKDMVRKIVDFVENNMAVLQLEDARVVCVSLKSKTNERNIFSVGYIKIGDSILDTFQYLKKEHDEKQLELISEDKWDIDIEVLSPIREFIEQIIKNAKQCPDIDYNDFLQRAGLEGF